MRHVPHQAVYMKIRAPIAGNNCELTISYRWRYCAHRRADYGIVPKNEALIIEAKLNPLDIDAVHPGLNAKVVLTGLSQRNAPRLLGKVTHASADALIDANTQKSALTAVPPIATSCSPP